MLPGVESWFSLGNKSRTGNTFGEEKVRQVADHVNMILRYIPYVQTNFVFGLDCDEGPEPFELTKKFVDLVPGAFPAYSLLTAFGRAAPLNLEFQRAGRVLSFPHHFLDNHGAMNVRPKNYGWSQFYEHMIDLTRHSFSTPTVARRFDGESTGDSAHAQRDPRVRGRGPAAARLLSNASEAAREGCVDARVLRGREHARAAFLRRPHPRPTCKSYWDALPANALYHDQNAYLRSTAKPPRRLRGAASAARLTESSCGTELMSGGAVHWRPPVPRLHSCNVERSGFLLLPLAARSRAAAACR